MNLGRFAEARGVLEQTLAQKIDTPPIHFRLYQIAFLQGDTGEMQRQMEWFRARPDESASFRLQRAIAEVAGQQRKARELRTQLVELFKRGNQNEAAAAEVAAEAQRDALYGHCKLVRQEAGVGLGIARSSSSLRTVALSLALCGELGQAQSLADEYARLVPNDTLANAIDLPVIRAAIANHRGNYAQAVDLLQTARRYERADSTFFAHYVRGQAFLGQHSAAEAAAEFQYILDHRRIAPFSLLHPLAYLGVAQSAAMNGDAMKARKAYEDFFSLWKDADAELPVLIEAKKEYEKLK